MFGTQKIKFNPKLKKIATLISVFLITVFAIFMMFENHSVAAGKYGELYEIENEYITRILPQTTVKDFKDNLETDETIVITKQDGSQLEADEFIGTGMMLTRGENTYKLSVIGDLDGNGQITITDLIKMRLYMSNLQAIEENYEKSADINGSGTRTVTDLTQLNLTVVGIKDLIAPQRFVPTVTVTTNSITVTGNTIDENSGIAEYYFKIDNGEWVQNADKTNGTYTFENLEANKTYFVRMKVKDNAGNEKITPKVETELICGSLEIIPITTEWTNKDVTVAVEANSNIAGAKILVSIDNGKTFEEYNRPIKVEKNTTVVAKLVDNNNRLIVQKEKEIKNIDKLAPKNFEIKTIVGINSIRVIGETEDAEATSENGQSGINEYKYIIEREFWKWENKDSEHEFSPLVEGENYIVKIIAIDKAGNETVIEKTISTKTKEELSDISLIASPSAEIWTNEDVIVTGKYPEIEGYTKQISTDDGKTWRTYTEPVVVPENTVIRARLINEDGETGREAILEIPNIDKEPPVISEVSEDSTSNSIKVDCKVTDNLSGVEAIYYTIDDGETWQEGNVFRELTPNTTYNIKIKAIDKAGNEAITETKEVTTKPLYTLTINANKGEYTGETIIIQEANTTTEINEPVKTGYTFIGWKQEGEGTLEEPIFTFGEGNTTLTAEWEIVEYIISYELDGGEATENPTKYTIESETITLNNPSKVGYTFIGWTGTELSEITETVTIPKGSTGDREYTANWSINNYNISYDLIEGTVSGENPLTYDVETETIKLNNPSKTGYTFIGWTGSNGNTPEVEVTIPKGSTGDKAYTANWEINEYTITYDANKGEVTPTSTTAEYNTDITMPIPAREYTVTYETNGGKEINSEKVEYTFNGWYTAKTGGVKREYTKMPAYDETVYAGWTSASVTLPIPEKEGYAFDGWYEDKELTKKIQDGSYTPTKDIILYAKWAINAYTITYDANEGEVSPSYTTAEYDTDITMPTPTREHTVTYETNGGEALEAEKAEYTFNGWYTAKTGGVKREYTKMPAYDETVYAQWTSANVTIKTPTKTGYTFVGWYEDKELTKEFKHTEYTPIKDITIYAKWAANTDTKYVVNHYKMELDGTYPVTATETESKTGTTGQEVTPAVKTYTGFTSPETQTVTISADGSTVVTYKYARNKYTYTLGTGTGVSTDGSTASGNYYYGATINIKATANTGYTWSKWTSSNTSLVEDKTEADTSFTMPAGNITMTPSVTLNTYTITYNLNGGSVTGNPTSYTVESNAITLKNPSKTGYTFAGWTGSNGNTASTTVTIPTGSSGNKEYTANWETNTNTKYVVNHYQMNISGAYGETATETENKTGTTGDSLTLANLKKTYTGFTYAEGKVGTTTASTTTIAADGSTVINLYYSRNKYIFTLGSGTGVSTNGSTASGSYYYGETITLKATANAGYTWSKWTSNNTNLVADKTTENTTFAMPVGDIKMTPNASKNTYTITYNLDGGKVTGNPARYDVTSDAITLNNPTKEGYTFIGWAGTDLSEATKAVTIPTGSTGDREYTATWSVNTYTITYNLDGGSVTGNPTSYTVESNTITLKNPSKTGYTFVGWTGSNGNTASTTVTIPTGSTENKEYTANWTINEYTLTYNANEGNVTPTSVTAEYNTSITMPTPTRSYKVTYNYNGATGNNTKESETAIYTFNGWYTATTGGIKRTYTAMPAYNEKLYAQWTSASVTLPTPEKTGYIFGGWYTDETLTNSITGTTYTPISNITLYAKWEIITYTITYDLTGGKVETTNPVSYTVESSTITLNNPIKPEYVFAGWTGTGLSAATKTVTIAKGSTGDRTYTATWVDAVATTETEGYASLADATKGAKTGQNIRMLDNSTETEIAAVSSGKSVTLNLSGYTVTYAEIARILNSGTLTITDSVTPPGKITINSTHNTHTVQNLSTGKLTLEKVTVENASVSGYQALSNVGTATLKSGTIANITSTSGTDDYYAVLTTGELNIEGGNIKAISVSGDGNQNAIAVGNVTSLTGTLNVTGGTIEANGDAIVNRANVNISDGEIIAGNDGLANSSEGTTTAIATIGTLDTIVDRTVPTITGARFGINASNSILNFYDGVIKGTKAISGTVNDVPDGYSIKVETTNSVQTATLVPIYTITLDGQSATTLGTTVLYQSYNDGIYLDSNASSQITTAKNPITIPSREGYTFEGYYTEINGNGIQMIDENGYLTTNFTSTYFEDNSILYAMWGGNIYVRRYDDGTLAFSSTEQLISGKTLVESYGDVYYESYSDINKPLWYEDRESITTVEFVNEINPLTTAWWFYSLRQVTNFNNIGNLNTCNVTDMSYMFGYSESLTSLDVSSFDTSKVTNMEFMFYYCGATTLNVSNFENNNVTKMNSMFRYCRALTDLNLTNFNTTNVKDMQYMFTYCVSLENLNLTGFDTGNLEDMSYMFQYCESLTSLDFSGFNTENVTTMYGVFYGCTQLTSLDLTSFDTNNVTDMRYLFYNCSKLATIYVSANTWTTAASASNMFKNCKTSSLTTV